MFDRHRSGVVIAVMLAVPTIAFAERPVAKPDNPDARALVAKAALAESTHAERQMESRP